MPKRSSIKQDRPDDDANDPNVTAFNVVQQATGGEPAEKPKPKPKKNAAAVALGRKGGKKGGVERAKRLTKEQRSEIARQGAAARWKKKRDAET